MRQARLERISSVRAVPEYLRGFVDTEAMTKGRDLTGDEQVALLIIEGTESRVAVFLDPSGVFDVEERLQAQDAMISREHLARLLEAAAGSD